jgi:TetR/AcrR family transcriptional regulator, mexCD-oprJ operon repressor
MPASPHGGRRAALQERVAAAIIEAAARVLASRGEQASMTDVANQAGLARATVYRYFPNRQALLDELGDASVRAAGERLASARIDEIPVGEGIMRAVRALVEAGDLFVVLARGVVRPDPEELERHVAGPLRRLVERGQASGEIRRDLPSGWLTGALAGIAVNVLSSPPAAGREDSVAAITSLFVDGARTARIRAA